VAIGDGPELEHREVRSPGESRARACPRMRPSEEREIRSVLSFCVGTGY